MRVFDSVHIPDIMNFTGLTWFSIWHVVEKLSQEIITESLVVTLDQAPYSDWDI